MKSQLFLRLSSAFAVLAVVAFLAAASSGRAEAQDIEKVVEILTAQPQAPPTSPAAKETDAPAAASAPLFFLRDSSKVAGKPRFERLGLETKYGVLQIPYEEIVRIRFARRLEPGFQEKIVALVTRLGAGDFDEREKATDELRRIGPPAVEILRAATKSSDDEVRNRAELLVQELDESKSAGEDESALRGTDDEVLTRRMTLKGRILSTAFAIETRYGALEIAVADLSSIHLQPTGAATRKVEVTPDFQPPGKWVDTKLDVDKRQSITVQASGLTQVSDWGFSSGPEGTNRYSGNTFGGFPPLALIGKVGKNGKPFKIGTQFKGKAQAKGRLYLAIVPFMYSPDSTTGKYEATIRLGSTQ